MAALYRGAAPGALIAVPMDAFVAVFHRPSGITHLLVEPAPQILAALDEGPATLAGLIDRLARDFEMAPGARDALAARLDELVEAGLVSDA